MLDLLENKDAAALMFYVTLRVLIILACWMFVILANLIDFWSGTATAKALGQPLLSHGFRRTVSKIGDYVKVMMFALMFDALGSLLSFYIIPFASILCTVAVLGIEGKSVLENSRRRKTNAGGIPGMVNQIMQAATREDSLKVLSAIATVLTSKEHAAKCIGEECRIEDAEIGEEVKL